MNVCPSRCVANVASTGRRALRSGPSRADQLERPLEEPPRRRLVQPDRVVVDDAPGREDHREGVDHQRRIEVLQVPRADDDRRDQQRRSPSSPTRRRGAARPAATRSARRRHAPARCWRGRNSGAFSTHSASARSAPAARSPARRRRARSRKNPSSSGGKKPPSPPMAPTRPVTVAVLVGKELRHQLEHRAVAERRAAPRSRARRP